MSSSFMMLRALFSSARPTPLPRRELLGANGAIGHWVIFHAARRMIDTGCADRWIERFLQRPERGHDLRETLQEIARVLKPENAPHSESHSRHVTRLSTPDDPRLEPRCGEHGLAHRQVFTPFGAGRDGAPTTAEFADQ